MVQSTYGWFSAFWTGVQHTLAIMRSTVARCLAIAVCGASGCATASGYVGTWAYEDAESYVGYELKGDETCRFVGVAKNQAGAGGFCRYERQNQTITIVEVWGGGSTKRWKLPAPYVMTYDAATDTLVLSQDDKSVRLTRAARLLGD